MKRFYLILILLSFGVCGFAKEYKVYGSQGGLAMEVTLPDDFNEETDKCPMVILMHGIFGVTYKEDKPQLVAKIEALIEQGVYPRNLWE